MVVCFCKSYNTALENTLFHIKYETEFQSMIQWGDTDSSSAKTFLKIGYDKYILQNSEQKKRKRNSQILETKKKLNARRED